MRIMLIRHGKVNMKWPWNCSSEEFDKACAEYDRTDIEKKDVTPLDMHVERIYVSKLSRSIDTAKRLFPDMEYCEMPEIGEVPLKSFKDTPKRLPLWIWNMLGRMQWYIGSARQLEKRKDTIQRAHAVIDRCESKKENCVLVTHGFFMQTLVRTLKKRGYKISGKNKLKITNLQMISAENCENRRD